MTIKKFTEEPTVHSFVLTDIEGKKKYAVVLNFLREFYCCESVMNCSIFDDIYKPLLIISILKGQR